MSNPYRQVEEPIELGSAAPGNIDWRPGDGTRIATIDLAGEDGTSGSPGSSGRHGSSGSTDSKGNRGRGGDGGDGGPGGHGTSGTDARSAHLRLRVRDGSICVDGEGVDTRIESPFKIAARGGDGGNGGDGGSGGSGGSGSPSGNRGSDGRGGNAGEGGDGGNIVLETDDTHLLGLVDDIEVRAGQGGSGGSGSPPGSSGRDGRPGSKNMVCGDEQGVMFGVVPTGIVLAPTPDRIEVLYARGSTIEINGVRIENSHGFSIAAPFAIRLRLQKPLVAETNDAINERRSVRRGSIDQPSNIVLPCKLTAKVPNDCDLGWYAMRVDLRSQRAGIEPHLTESRDVGLFRIAVNHRLVESEIKVDAADLGRLRTLCDEMNRSTPEAQVAYFTGGLLASTSPGLAVERLQDRAEIGEIFEGRLLEVDEMWDAYDTVVEEPRREAIMAGAVHFFRALPRASQEKVLDAAFHVSGRDEVLDATEKGRLKKVAAAFGLDEEWLAHKMPRVLAAGDSQVKATNSNLINAFGAIALLVPLSMIVRHIVASLGEEKILRVAGGGGFFDFVLFVLTGAVMLEPLRRGLLRTACASCGSLELQHLDDTNDASLTGEGDAIRCRDCGARGNLYPRHARAMLHSDCRLSGGRMWPYLVGTAVVTIGLALYLHRHTPKPAMLRFDGGNLFAFAAVAIIYYLIFARAREVRVWWTVLAIVASVVTVIILGS